MSTSTEHSPYRSRWARPDDLPAMWRIANSHGDEGPFEGLDLAELASYVLRRHPFRHSVVRVAADQQGTPVVGYACFEVKNSNSSCYLNEVAVVPAHRRKGVAGSLLDLVPTLAPYAPAGHAWKSLVRETNLDAQLFLKSQGWRCVKTIAEGDQGSFDCPPEGAYCFLFDPSNGEAPGPSSS